VVGILKLAFHYPLVGLVLPTLIFKGSFASSHLVAQHSDAPDVNSIVVGLANYYLWGDVVQGSTEGLSWLLRRVNTPAEIR